jgi:hypothetical protein
MNMINMTNDTIINNNDGTVTEADTGTVYATTRIRSSTVLVCLSVKVWSAEKTDDDATTVVEEDAGCQSGEAGKFRKVLMKNHVLSEIKKVRQRASLYNKNMSKPWNDCGERIMPQIDRLEHKAKVDEFKAEYEALVNTFINDYAGLIAGEAHRLQGLFKSHDYPSVAELREKFSFDCTYTPVPDAGHFLTTMGDEARDELIEQFNASTNRRIRNVVKVVAGEFYKNLKHLVERLTDKVSDDGEEKRGRLFKSLIVNTEASIASLRKMNITDDPELFAAADELEAVINNTDINELKHSSYARQDTKAKVKAIMDKFDF